MKKCYFEGWYFKHQSGERMISFIPGYTKSGAFVQVVSSEGSQSFDVPFLMVDNDAVRAGSCIFSRFGSHIDLPDINGDVTYGSLRPLKSDIMGPFRFFPMECRHGIISMTHSLNGSISYSGKRYSFKGETGYIEKDSGTSFPSSYLWLQCSSFGKACSIMFSAARIPFCGTAFNGFICAVVFNDMEYRFATYNGARLLTVCAEHICISRGRLFLEIEVTPSHPGYTLNSPQNGMMSGRIRESTNTAIRIRMWESGQAVFDLSSPNAAYELVPGNGLF